MRTPPAAPPTAIPAIAPELSVDEEAAAAVWELEGVLVADVEVDVDVDVELADVEDILVGDCEGATEEDPGRPFAVRLT